MSYDELDQLALAVARWIDGRDIPHSERDLEDWADDYCERHNTEFTAAEKAAFKKGFNSGSSAAYQDLVELLEDNGWDAVNG